jgi:septal ring factor EnvC (AmiA/AmiB activator)
MQTDSAVALYVGARENQSSAGPSTFDDGAEEDESEADFSDIEAVSDQQIDDMKKLQMEMDPMDAHRAAVAIELDRLERLRLELIAMEQERQRLLAEQQAARDAAEKKRLQDEADQLQQDKERMLREEKAKQQLMEKLRSIGKCPAGFTWTKTSSGYVCARGSHHVSDHQL